MSERQRESGLAYRFQVSNWLDKWLFVFLLFVGTCGMFVLWHFSIRQLWVTSWPVFILLVYTIFLLGTKRYQIREDRAGDNLYYLGFIFTLVSLGHALFILDDGEDSAQKLITDFGIALTTTIFGLALRVFLNQLREDPIETERTAREELALTVGELRATLGGMVQDVNTYRRTVEQSIVELNKETETAIEKGIKTSTQSYETLITNIEQTIKSSAAGIETSIETLVQASKSASESVESLSKRMAAIEIPPEVVERAINKPFEKIDQILKTIEARQQEGSNTIAALATTINNINQSIESLRASILAVENITIPENLITNSIRPVFSDIEGLLGEIRQSHEADSKLLQEFSATIETLTVSTTQLSQSLQSVTSTTTAIAGMQSEFSGLSSDINRVTQDISNTLSQHKDVIESLHVDADETVQYLAHRRATMESEIEMIQSANRQIFDHLAQLSNVIVEKLGK